MRESTRIENSKTTKRSDSPLKHSLNKGKDSSSCGSCSACKSLHSPQMSSQSASSVLSYAKAIGKESCAVSFMQRNYGNRFTTGVLSQPSIQKKCSCGGSCAKCKGEEEADRISMSIMKMSKTSDISYQPSANNNERGLISEIMSSKGSGHGLDVNIRSFMGEKFGYDFSHVRLHNDSYAAKKSDELNAEAFTIGRDVFFNAGRYNPSSTGGKQLLAHELTHVVQQTIHTSRSIQKKIEVNSGLTLDTMGYTTSKSGNVYSCPRIVKDTIWHELFTALLFSPRIFKLKGTTNSQINSSFRKHMQARYGVLDFASKKRYIFGAGVAFRMNPAYWIVDSSGWRLKPGVDRAEAINDINVHPDKYAIACQAATLLTMIGGGRSNIVDGSSPDISDWIPGDWGYITNTSFPSGGPAGLEGENIIYIVKDKFWGHFGPGNEYKTLTEWFNRVKSWHGSASIESTRRIPDAGLE